MKFSTVILYIITFIFRCGTILDVICDDLERSAALDLGKGVEQPFHCLIAQNCQAMQPMGRLMDWTLEDDMVNGLFFCATLTGRKGSHTLSVQAGEETSDTDAEAVKPDPGSS